MDTLRENTLLYLQSANIYRIDSPDPLECIAACGRNGKALKLAVFEEIHVTLQPLAKRNR
jgi:hypothetical protein